MLVCSSLFFRYSSLTCVANLSAFLTPMSRYLLKRPILALCLVSLPHSSPFPRSFPSLRAGKHYSDIPPETSYGYTSYSDINTSAVRYCFSHITILLCSRNTDTPLLSMPSCFPSVFSLFYHILHSCFNCYMTLPDAVRSRSSRAIKIS